MRVVTRNETQKTFGQLNIGDVFINREEDEVLYYMKVIVTYYNESNAVNFEGVPYRFEDDEIVEPVDAEVVIK